MPAHNHDTQITCGFDSNQNPNEYRVVYCEYKYNNNKKENIYDPYARKDFP